MRVAVFFILLLLAQASNAQGKGMIFSSYQAFEQDSGEYVGEYADITISMGRHVVLFRNGDDTRRVPCASIWGFKVNELIFRILEPDKVPMRLMTQGALCYYENGFAHLRMWSDSTSVTTIERGFRSYMSKDLDSPMVPAIFAHDDTRSKSATFRSAHPELESLFSCIGGEDDLLHTRQCVVDFEVAREEGR